jgi:uncharacterized repeat protein (TIGR03803 family)
MNYKTSPRRLAHSVTSSLLLLICATSAYADTFNFSNRQLSIPSLVIGGATYTNMVVTVGNIVTLPSGTSANGSEDSYDPQTNLLTVQTVVAGPATYHNAVVSVANLVSCDGVTGADSYNGASLSISIVQVGATTYEGVVVAEALSNVISVAGGMPTDVPDTYSSPTNQLAIPAVQVGNHVYTNVIVTAGNLISVAGIYGSFQEMTLYSFGSGPAGSLDGANPQAALIQGGDGLLYGTTDTGGGPLSGGTVFTLTTDGVETVLYSFCSVGGVQCTDGNSPVAGVIEGSDGNFYGTTEIGGLGSGTVFKLTPAGAESVLYAFCGTSGSGACAAGDGANPQAGLIQTGAVGGNFYGTTFSGGAYNQGTVFQVTPAGVETVLHSFSGNGGVSNSTDGANPLATLILASDGNLYGTTEYGGADNLGTVFKITLAGVETQLYSFVRNGADGSYPKAGVIQASDGNFYGMTSAGGTTNGGTIYRVNSTGVETVLYSFNQSSLSTDGYAPRANLLQASDGNIYGTTNDGGINGPGIIFKITPDGIETVLHSFGNGTDGSFPQAGLFQDSQGNFYGTTYVGGANGSGAVFKLTDVITPR